MYDLPENPTAANIIDRSIACHPSLFAHALDTAAKVHSEALRTMTFLRAVATARRLEKACITMANAINEQRFSGDEAVIAGPDHWITALNIAVRLQALPRHILTQAAIRTQEAIDLLKKG